MIIKSPVPDIEIPERGVYHFLFQSDYLRYIDKEIFIDGITGEKLTYGELKRNSKRLAAGLINKAGFERGDVLAIVSPNKIDYPIILFGVIAAGGKVTPVNPAHVIDEFINQLLDSGTKYIVTSSKYLTNVINAAAKANIPQTNIFLIDGEENRGIKHYSSLMSEREAIPVEYSPKEVKSTTAYLCYSAGTTGRCKGVEITHFNMVANLSQMYAYEEDINSDTIFIGVWPFFHIYGLSVLAHFTLIRGASAVLAPEFDLSTFGKIIQEYNVNAILFAPRTVLTLIKNPIARQYDLSSLRFCISAASPLSKELAEKFTRLFNVPIKQGYGLTEASPTTHLVKTFKADDYVVESIGRPIPNIECKIISENGEELGYDQPGELYVRGPNVMKGYLNNKEATDGCIDSEGWLHTGDLVTVDKSENFYIVDRIKEVIKCMDEAVPPSELESILLTHESVADAAVVGIYVEQEATEHPLAYVVLQEGIPPTGQLKELIKDFVDQKVSDYKQLRGGVEFINEIPRNASGKILRRSLRKHPVIDKSPSTRNWLSPSRNRRSTMMDLYQLICLQIRQRGGILAIVVAFAIFILNELKQRKRNKYLRYVLKKRNKYLRYVLKKGMHIMCWGVVKTIPHIVNCLVIG